MWLNQSNAWTQPLLRQATAQWLNWLEKSARMDSLEIRHFNQATRELLLAQSSDWPFLLNAGTAGDYPSRRIQGHLANFNALEAARHSTFGDLAELVRLESQNNPFQRLSPWKWVERGLQSSCENHWKAACLKIPVQESLSNSV